MILQYVYVSTRKNVFDFRIDPKNTFSSLIRVIRFHLLSMKKQTHEPQLIDHQSRAFYGVNPQYFVLRALSFFFCAAMKSTFNRKFLLTIWF